MRLRVLLGLSKSFFRSIAKRRLGDGRGSHVPNLLYNSGSFRGR